tara:strand:+ start:28785 stop:29204 length:420 start_codon:yes stop_codon:yes gene_type:complete
MQEQLVSFETAKLAKEKGFKEKCIFAYGAEEEASQIVDVKDFTCWLDFNSLESSEYWNVSAPTQPSLQKWLRDHCNMHIDIMVSRVNYRSDVEFHYSLSEHGKGYSTQHSYRSEFTGTYEEALEIVLKEALRIIKRSIE